MEELKSEYVTKKHYVKTEFKYKHPLELEGYTAKTYFFVTEEYDFKLKWTIQHFSTDGYFHYSLKLDKIYRNITGEYEIHSSYPNVTERGSFDYKSMPLQKSYSSSHSKMPIPFKSKIITVTVKVLYDDKGTNSALDNYRKLLENSKYFDVTFVVAGEEIPAHQLIMSAQSDYFAKMFETNMVENKSGRVDISDVEPSVFKQLLRFIYYAQIDTTDVDELLKLLQAADKYLMIGLVNNCENLIATKLRVDNVIDTLIIADLVKAAALKKDCINYIILNKQEIVKTQSYRDMIKAGRADLFSDIFCEMQVMFVKD